MDVSIPKEILLRIGIVSDGFPHFVHLIGQCMFYAMNDDQAEVTKCQRSHYDAGIKEALQQTEPPLRAAYFRATEKTKNKLEYEETLWALADRAETRRQVSNIIDGHGSGYFSFRENVMRGFVRLKAESEGVELIPDVL
jgi:hypothetical protein